MWEDGINHWALLTLLRVAAAAMLLPEELSAVPVCCPATLWLSGEERHSFAALIWCPTCGAVLVAGSSAGSPMQECEQILVAFEEAVVSQIAMLWGCSA